MPEPDALPEDLDGVPLRSMLRVINERIEYLFDREHQIGHAYFLGCGTRADIDRTMKRKVIPLLAEYFYEDWTKIAVALGEGNADGSKGRFIGRTELKAPGGPEAGEPRYRWHIREEFAPDAYEHFRRQ